MKTKTFASLLTGSMVSATFFVSSIGTALAVQRQADLQITDKLGTMDQITVRVENLNAPAGDSAMNVYVKVTPVSNLVYSFSYPYPDCVKGTNGSFTCPLYPASNTNTKTLGGNTSRLLSAGMVLSASACSKVFNGNIKVAKAEVMSTTADPSKANNVTNVYIKASCPNQ